MLTEEQIKYIEDLADANEKKFNRSNDPPPQPIVFSSEKERIIYNINAARKIISAHKHMRMLGCGKTDEELADIHAIANMEYPT